MAGSLLRIIPRQWLYRFGWLCLALTGLGLVANYTYFVIRHDMALITAKQANLFEVFYQRARILAPEKLADFIHRQQQHQDAHLQRERGCGGLCLWL